MQYEFPAKEEQDDAVLGIYLTFYQLYITNEILHFSFKIRYAMWVAKTLKNTDSQYYSNSIGTFYYILGLTTKALEYKLVQTKNDDVYELLCVP